MWGEIKKMWFDTMQNEGTNRYGMKRLQSFAGSVIAFLFSLPFIIELHIYPVLSLNLTPPPMELIYGWMAFAGVTAGLNVIGKGIADKSGNGKIEE